MNKVDYLKVAQEVFDAEIEASNTVRQRLDETFVKACQLILNCEGRVIVTGIGKSGHIGRKIAATLASTGTPAFFIHPSEAVHGDIGMITVKDILLAITYSGNTPEILALLPVIKLLALPLIGITGNVHSTLAGEADLILNVEINREAGDHGLAPTSSTTATLMMGDALALAVSTGKGFSSEDFARSHPGGILGQRLTKRIKNLMTTGEKLPLVSEETMLVDASLEMSRKGLGLVIVVLQDKVLGVYTDGDLRRSVAKGVDFKRVTVGREMTRQYKVIKGEVLAVEAIRVMENNGITALIVEDEEERIEGVIHLHDLLRSGLI